jgi:hypothetical protein
MTQPGQRAPSLARRLGLGRLLYLAVHAPLAALARSRREGGPVEQWKTARGRRAMAAAVASLPQCEPVGRDAAPVTFLTGRRFWFQTAFCFWTLRQRSAQPRRLVLLDDGSLDRTVVTEAGRLFPGTLILGREEIEARLDRALPAKQFPCLRMQRKSYVHLRKLTDAHAGTAGWKVVMDSDMLFFRRPLALDAWLDAPQRPLHMLDVQNAYGYPEATLQSLLDAPLPPRVNVGILGLQSDSIDWATLEKWCRNLLEQHGTSYYLEQALSALLLAKAHPVRLDAAEYRVMPDADECRHPSAVLHHYVAESKAGYFRHAWRRARTS